PELAASAAERLCELGADNVVLRVGDGSRGLPEGAPYDRILATAAPAAPPEALFEQLRPGGILVAPVGTFDQRLGCWRKTATGLEYRDLGAVRFVPLVAPS